MEIFPSAGGFISTDDSDQSQAAHLEAASLSERQGALLSSAPPPPPDAHIRVKVKVLKRLFQAHAADLTGAGGRVRTVRPHPPQSSSSLTLSSPQLTLYAQKFDEFQETLAKSNEIYARFKKEMNNVGGGESESLSGV